jgi:hypothetical protein
MPMPSAAAWLNALLIAVRYDADGCASHSPHEIEMTVAAGAIALTISLSSSTSNSPELGAAS